MTLRVRRLVASALVVSFISLPGALSAQGKRGVDLIVTPKDGPSVSGELIAVKQSSLLLLTPVGKDVSVDLYQILTIIIAKKSKAGSGFLTGFIIGGIAGGILGASGEDPPVGKGGAIFLGALLIGGVCGLVGLGIGAAAGSDETIEFGSLSEAEASQALDRLRGMARMRSAQ
jgi:hypothetical protein